MTESPSTGVVSGTHRATRSAQFWLWIFFAAVGVAQVVLASSNGPHWRASLYVVWAATGLATAWMLWSQRTVIAPRGLRVKAGWRWSDLTWDDVRSVDAPSRWSPTQVLSVTTTDGDVIATHVPADLHQDLVAYVAEHRSSRQPNGDRT